MDSDKSDTVSDIKEEKKENKQRIYSKTRLKKYHENKNNKIICDICKGKYDAFHKSEHMKSKKHLKATGVIFNKPSIEELLRENAQLKQQLEESKNK
jgi:hypothetical protein